MGYYHNRLNKRNFKNSVYIKKFEELHNIKIKNHTLQYEIIFDTINVYLDLNNILFSKKYIPLKEKVNKMKELIDTYINTYKSKINKSYDLNCFDLYETLLEYQSELLDIKQTKPNLKSFETRISSFVLMLDMLEYDKLYDSKGMTYQRQVNEKIPKKYNCKFYTDDEINDNLLFGNNKLKLINDSFIENYLNITGIDLNIETKQKEFIITIHKNIEYIQNALVDYYTYKDTIILDIATNNIKDFFNQDINYIEDIYYRNIFNKFKTAFDNILNKDFDNALKLIDTLINNNISLYERVS